MDRHCVIRLPATECHLAPDSFTPNTSEKCWHTSSSGMPTKSGTDNCPCLVSMYLAVFASNLAGFGSVALSRRIWRFQFISETAAVPDRWFHNAEVADPR